ncbi:MAG: sigma factor-like helix-turn-helix DNA-binding protein [Evtepia sp.]|nr:sigma factor-like helix-turn-helix DNA-binding protein [Evtepia sp.]MDY3014231.1 sigma factor-like helix-turn-helix DNA-binding protein [Evtepia sp.]
MRQDLPHRAGGPGDRPAVRPGRGRKGPRTQREIASRCGISRSYVSRLEKKALSKLRAEMEKGAQPG